MRRRFGWQQLVGTCALLLALGSLWQRTWAFSTASVGLQQSGTFYPAVNTTGIEVVDCRQPAPTLQLNDDNNYPGSFFECTNNWGRPVTLTINVLNSNGSGLTLTGHTGTLPAGATACIPGANMMAPTPVSTRAVSYQVLVDQADLYVSVVFSGNIRVRANAGNPALC